MFIMDYVIGFYHYCRVYVLQKKSNRKVYVIWNYTPTRSCIPYMGEKSHFRDFFKSNEYIIVDKTIELQYEVEYDFQYWLKKDMIVNINHSGNIFINYGLYTLISEDDDPNSMFKDLFNTISKPCQIEFDNIGVELGLIFKSLHLIDELQIEIDKTQKLFLNNMIGIHIRKTDGGFVHYDWVNIIKKLLSHAHRWCMYKNNGIFLATDDFTTYLEFKRELGDKLIFYNPPQILCNTLSQDKFQNDKYNVLCGLVEMNLLGLCNKYIIGTVDSTFSICAMLLSNSNTKKYLINNADNVPDFTHVFNLIFSFVTSFST